MYYSDIFERSVAVGEYIAATGATVRQAAKRFGVGKSTVHKDVTSRLAAAHIMLPSVACFFAANAFYIWLFYNRRRELSTFSFP